MFTLDFLLLFSTFPVMPNVTPFRQLAAFSEETSRSISDRISQGLHSEIVNKYIETYKLEGNSVVIQEALKQNIRDYSSIFPDGIVEFLTAKDLFEHGEYPASAKLMIASWNSIDEKLAIPEVLDDLSLLTEGIIRQYHGPETAQLERVYKNAIKKWRQRDNNDNRP